MSLLHARWKVELKITHSGKEIRYHIADDTNIANVWLKQLLSNEELVYLSEYVISWLERFDIDYAVNYDLISKRSQEGLLEILHHSHEEGDKLLIIQFGDIARTNPFYQCTVLKQIIFYFPYFTTHHFRKD